MVDLPTAFSSMMFWALVFAAAMVTGLLAEPKRRRRNEMMGDGFDGEPGSLVISNEISENRFLWTMICIYIHRRRARVPIPESMTSSGSGSGSGGRMTNLVFTRLLILDSPIAEIM